MNSGCRALVEDEPIIALGICNSLQGAGASGLSAYTLCEALRLADHPDISVAVADFGLSDGGEADPLCERLTGRGIPFVLYAGKSCRHAVPVSSCLSREMPKQLVDSVVQALGAM